MRGKIEKVGRRLAFHPVLAIATILAACGGEPPDLSVQTSATGPARVVAFDPPQGATGVDPGRTTLAVTFDRPMDPEGWAWVIEDESTAPEVGDSSWDASHRTNTARVRLEPGRSYVLWVNSTQFDYFKDLHGVPATPTRWVFTTATQPRAGGDIAPIAAHAVAQPPRVVELDPPQGASEVDPALGRLRVVFDRPMAEGWSWVNEGAETFPKMAGGASQSEDRVEAYLPVELEPGRSYVVWLNSDRFRDFRDPAGATLSPVRWTFSTRRAAE